MAPVPPSSDSVREHWLGGESSDSGDTQEEALAMYVEEATLGWSERTFIGSSTQCHFPKHRSYPAPEKAAKSVHCAPVLRDALQ